MPLKKFPLLSLESDPMDIPPGCSHQLHPYELIPEIVARYYKSLPPDFSKRNPFYNEEASISSPESSESNLDLSEPESSEINLNISEPESSEINPVPMEETPNFSLPPDSDMNPNEEASISSLQPESLEMNPVPMEETPNFSLPPDSEMNPMEETPNFSLPPDSEMYPYEEASISSLLPDPSEIILVPREESPNFSAPPNQLNIMLSETSTSDAVGFIGLGSIGRKILKKFFVARIPLYIYDRHMKNVKTTRITKCNNPADVIQKCNIIFYCEPEIKYAELMIFGRPNGVVEGFEVYNSSKTPSSKDKGFVMLETISSELSMRINETIHAVNGLYVEAPMIGTLQMAHYNLLKMIAVGDRSLFHECEKYFKMFAIETKFLEEPIGRALDLKVIYSMIEGTMTEALKEVFTMTQKVDVAKSTVFNMLGSSPLNEPILMAKADALVHDEPENTNTIRALQRDMALVVNAIDNHNNDLEANANSYHDHVANANSDHDQEADANSDHLHPFCAPIAEMYRQTLVNSLLESDSADRSASLLKRAVQQFIMDTVRPSMKRKL